MRGTLHNETNKPRHTVPQRGGAGNETFMCKGCTLRIDTWFLIEVTQSNHCDLMYTNTAVDLNYSRRGQRNSKPAVVVVLFVFLYLLFALLEVILRDDRSFCSEMSDVAAGSMAESAAVFSPWNVREKNSLLLPKFWIS